MRELIWKMIAYVASRKPVAEYLIRRSQRTPYIPIGDYMDRWWLFNPYNSRYQRMHSRWLPSIRVHHIKRPDSARHLHDHPWNARTIILRGYYFERKLGPNGNVYYNYRRRGDTARVLFNEYHSIDDLSINGVFTLFFTWEYRGTWGFLVDGVKVPHNEYKQDA